MSNYPNIDRAAVAMALDNGTINSRRSEDDVLAAVAAMTEFTAEELARVDSWLGTLSDEDFETVCSGEHDDIAAIVTDEAQRVLEHIFNEVI